MTSLKERVERNAAMWLLGSLVLGFSAGIGTYRGIQEIAGLTAISPKQYDEYEAAKQRVVEQERELVDLAEENDELTRELRAARDQGASDLQDELDTTRRALENETRARERLEAEIASLRTEGGSSRARASRPTSDQGAASDLVRTIEKPGQFRLGRGEETVLLTTAGIPMTVSGQPNSAALYVNVGEEPAVHLGQGRSLPLAGTDCRVRLLDVDSPSGHVFELRCE